MILKRISEDLKSQNWTALCLELAIVVIGIFLGLQGAQWYEDRQELILEKSITERLQTDFEAISAEANSAFEFHQQQALALELIRQSLINEMLDMDREDQFLDGLRYSMGFDNGSDRSGTYFEIVSIGQLRLLRDSALRSALNDYDDTIQKSDSFFSNLYQNLKKHEYVFHRHFTREATQELPVEGAPTGILLVHGEIAEYDFDAMVADEEFLFVLERLIETHINFQIYLGNINRSANRVLDLLESNDR